MKINKLYIAFFIATIFFVACDDYEDTVVPSPTVSADNPAARFSGDNASSFELDPSVGLSFSLTVKRSNTSGALEVPVNVITNTENSFVIPSSVSFSAGEETATLNISMSESAPAGQDLPFSISLGEDFVNPYKNEYGAYYGTVSIIKWNSLGTVQFYDAFSFYQVTTVTLEQRDDIPEMYRINSPYKEDILLDAEWEGWIGGTTQDKITFTAEGGNVIWDGFWYTNLLYQGVAGQEIKAYLPSAINKEGDDLSVVVKDETGDILYFKMVPYFYIDGLGGWAPDAAVYLGFPGFDLAGALGLPVFGE